MSSEDTGPLPDAVILRTVVEINGRRYAAQAQANVEAWRRDPRYRDHVKADLLRALGEGIVNGLNPEVTVIEPGPTLHEALTEALRPFDYPQEH